MNLIMESTTLMSLPGRMFSLPQKAEKNSEAVALVHFSGYGGVPHVFRRQHEHVSGWHGGGILRLRGLVIITGYM